VQTQSTGLVVDPRGGVILIGGRIETGFTSSIYKLEHAESQWKLIIQKLKIESSIRAAFLIPDSLAPNCTLN
jgi:hypothetical protein